MEHVAKKIVFSGRVQGVGFRYTAQRMAQQYELVGFVRNLSNGGVEMFAQGDQRDVNNCIADIERHFEGHISNTHTEDMTLTGAYDRFFITF